MPEKHGSTDLWRCVGACRSVDRSTSESVGATVEGWRENERTAAALLPAAALTLSHSLSTVQPSSPNLDKILIQGSLICRKHVKVAVEVTVKLPLHHIFPRTFFSVNSERLGPLMSVLAKSALCITRYVLVVYHFLGKF